MADPGGSDRFGAEGVGSDLRIWRGRWRVGSMLELGGACELFSSSLGV